MFGVLKQRGQGTPEIAYRYNVETQDAFHQEGLFMSLFFILLETTWLNRLNVEAQQKD